MGVKIAESIVQKHDGVNPTVFGSAGDRVNESWIEKIALSIDTLPMDRESHISL